MSFSLMNLLNNKRCGSPVRRSLLLALAHYADDDGMNIFPAISTLAERIDIHPRTVQRNLNRLIKDGLLENAGKRRCRHGYTREYRLNLAILRALPTITRVCSRVPPDRSTPGAAPPLDTPGAPPGVPTSTPGPVSSNPRRRAAQSYQGYNAAAAPEDPWVSAVLAIAGPGLADPDKYPRIREDLASVMPAWRANGWDLEQDIMATFRDKTSKPRGGGALHKPSILEEDIAARHRKRMASIRNLDVGACAGTGSSRPATPPTQVQRLAHLKFDLERLQAGRPFREYRENAPPPEGWEAYLERQIAEITQQMEML